MAKKRTKTIAPKTPKVPLRPLFIGLAVMLLVLAAFNAQLIVASVRAYIIPDTAQISEISLSPTYDGQPRIVVPKINVDAPVVYTITSVSEDDVQIALQKGVLHFGDTPLPGKHGNAVYVGHSSGQPWAPGDYNFVFMRLAELEDGDKIYLYHEGVRYIYQVFDKKVVKTNDVSVLENTDAATLTLITCTPVGTNINRLIVKGELIDPKVAEDAAQEEGGISLSDSLSEHDLPGNSYDPVQAVRALFDQ